MPVGSLQRLWEICNAMTTSDGFLISISSVVDSALHGPTNLMVHPALVFQDGVEQMGSLKSHMTAALIDRDGAVQVCPPAAAIEQSCTGGAQESEANRGRGSDAPQLSSRRDWDISLFRGPVSSPQGYQKLRYSQQQHGHRVEYDGEYEYPARHPGDLTPACPRVQQHGTFGYDDSMILPGFPARLAASGPLVQSDRSNGPSSPATPPDEPKGRCSALTRLSQARGPTSQPFTHQVGSQQLLDPMAVI